MHVSPISSAHVLLRPRTILPNMIDHSLVRVACRHIDQRLVRLERIGLEEQLKVDHVVNDDLEVRLVRRVVP